MLSPIRERARVEWIDRILDMGRDITSNGDEALFTELTGGAVAGFTSRHAWLLDQWDVQHKGTTTCNEFIGAYGRKLGFNGNLGRFPIAAYLKEIKMGYAWVRSTDEVRPKYGDICRFTAYHMGISVTWDYDESAASTWTWHTVESGQGGPNSRCDIIKAKVYPDRSNRWKPIPAYTPKVLEGWIDIDLFFAGHAPQDGTDGGALSSLWRNEDDDVVHPDAPAGGGGPGYFRAAGTLPGDAVASSALPHPAAPAARYLDPLRVEKLRNSRG